MPLKYKKDRKLQINRQRKMKYLGHYGHGPRNYIKPTGFKMKEVVPVSSGGTGFIVSYITNNPNSAQDWSSLSALYDAYKCSAIKLQWIPALPNNESTTTAYRPFYINMDPDTTAGPGSVNEIIQYENVKIFNLYRPFKVYYKFPRYSQSGTSNTKIYSRGYIDAANPVNIGSIQYISEGLTNSTLYGQFVVTYYVSFIMRR